MTSTNSQTTRLFCYSAKIEIQPGVFRSEIKWMPGWLDESEFLKYLGYLDIAKEAPND